jgi:hypothetical protein
MPDPTHPPAARRPRCRADAFADPRTRRRELVDLIATGLARIAVAGDRAGEDRGFPGNAPASAIQNPPESAATCLELPRCPGLSVPAGEPDERARGPCRRAR